MKRPVLLVVVVLLFLVVSHTALSQSITVYDGPTPGSDLDWWTESLNIFRANWKSTINWSSYATLGNWYVCQLWRDGAAGPTEVDSKEVPFPHTTGIPPTSVVFSGAGLLNEGDKYWVEVTGYYTNVAGAPIAIESAVSDGAVVDTVGPTVTMAALPATQSANTFTVSWSGSDALSGVDRYDVQYRAGSGMWQSWLRQTRLTSYSFTGDNGQTYAFRARARDVAGNTGEYSAPQSTTINAMQAALSVTATPGSLSFSSTESSLSLKLDILATATGSISVTSIEEQRDYPSWGTESGVPQAVSLTITGGTSASLSRTVSLTSLQRSKALGTSTVGGFTLSYLLHGVDTLGTPVQGQVSIPVTVQGGLASTLSVTGVSLSLPPSPFYVGDVISNPTVTIQATGSGVVQGQVLVDGSLGWTANPSFTVSVSGTTSFPVTGTIPTTTPGGHTVRVELSAPVILSDQKTYTVSAATPPFPPATLVLVPGTAELTDLSGNAFVTSASGYEEYSFTGTATLRLPSLGGVELPGAEVTSLLVRYEDSAPTVAKIRGGTVEKLASGPEVLAHYADDTLRIKKVYFEGGSGAPTDHILVDSMLVLPGLGGSELLSVEDLTVRSGGIEPQSLHWTPGDGKAFTAFGLEFKLHDRTTTPAFRFEEDSAHGYAYILAGSLHMDEKVGSVPVQVELTQFTGLRFYSDGEAEGALAFGSSYEIIPGVLSLEEAEIVEGSGGLALALGGTIAALPEPFQDLPATDYSLLLDLSGDSQGPAEPIAELAGGHSLDGGGDASEWEYSLATLDITYLGVDLLFNQGVFEKSQSSVLIGADFYLDCRYAGSGDVPPDEERRIGYGEWTGGALAGGVELALDGSSFWNPPDYPLDFETAFGDKKLKASSLTIRLDNLLPVTDPFLFHCSGSIILVDLPAIEGDIDFDELHLALDGTTHLPPDADTSGDLSIMSVIDVSVNEVEWSESPTSLSFSKDTTLDDGTNRSFQADESHTISVDSYVRLLGATLNLSFVSSLSAGGFEELTVYEQAGQHNFVLKQAHVSLSEVELKADVEYVDEVLRLAGELKIPGPDGQIKAIAVGKIGVEAGQPTMGLFVAASNLSIAVAPGIFLDEVGGGLFINPVTRDIDDVKRLARFERPDMGLDDKIMEKKPGGAGNPGGFALMFVGGFYVSSKDVFKGRALFVVTQNYFSLDAEAEFGKGLVEAYAFMEIGWDPAYAEGYLEVDLDFLKILEGHGNLGFYAYASDTWGVFGEFNIEFLSMDIASGSMFIGPPGFMMETEVSVGVDLVIVSGYIKFGGMFWYNKAADPATWGAYAMVEVKGELLKGLLSASAKLEGALIGAPEFLIYAVGSVKFRVCWVTVFEGSLWVSAGERGLDGGTGRNSKYDQLIEDARNMADQMNQAREDLLDALEQAQLEMAILSEEQLEAAGLSLIERSGLGGAFVSIGFAFLEEEHWQPGGLPTQLAAIRAMMFGSGQENIVARRTELQQLADKIEDDLEDLGSLQEAVAERLELYEDILLDDLPAVAELGSLKNPLEMETRTVTVGEGEPATEIVDFSVNESQAQAQRDSLSSIREEFAAFQESFIEQAGMIDARLQQLDEILFQDSDNLSSLNQDYAGSYLQMTQYLSEYIDFQDASKINADIMLGLMDLSTSAEEVESLLLAKAATVDPAELNEWIDDRIVLLDTLVKLGGEEQGYSATTDPANPTFQIAVFGLTGTQLWWDIPRQGFSAMSANAPAKKEHALETFSENARSFRLKWTQASQITDAYFERKAELYDVLYEIYDQLATYGSGMIGISGEGNAAGFEGLAGSGLGFRSSAVADAISTEGTYLPPGSIPGSGRTIDPLTAPKVGPGGMPAGPRPGGGGEHFPGGGKVPGRSQIDPDAGGTGNPRTAGNPTSLLSGLGLSVLTAGGASGGTTGKTPGAAGISSAATITGSIAGQGMVTLDLSLDSETKGLPISGAFDRDLSSALAPAEPVSWVPVDRYFASKRAEITPYTEIPVVESFTGSVRSEDAATAVLSAAFSASHPVGVVEYAYRVEPAQSSGTSRGERLPSRQLDLLSLSYFGQGSGIGAGSAVTAPLVTSGALTQSQAQAVGNYLQNLEGTLPSTSDLFRFQAPPEALLAAIKIVIPWFSLGSREEILEPFFSDLHEEGQYYLYLRVRGAGGKTIVRRATIDINYFDPNTDSSPVVTTLDASDKSPPAVPIVTPGSLYSARTDLLYAAWDSDDPESGIQSFEYAVGTYEGDTGGGTEGAGSSEGTARGAPLLGSTLEDIKGVPGQELTVVSVPTDILDWTSAGGRKEANIRGLELEHGREYVISVRATNGVGLSSVGSSDPILVDTTPPEQAAITGLAQVTADGYPNSVEFTFQEATDPESGIVSHRIALGTTAELDNLFPWTEVTGSGATVANLPVLDGSTVYLLVRATNGAELETTAVASLDMQFSDGSPPPEAAVTTDPALYLADGSQVGIGWGAVHDPQSGVIGYQYGIGTSPQSADVLVWIPVGSPRTAYLLGQGAVPGGGGADSVEVEATDLGLTDGQSYYAVVKTINGAGLESIGASEPFIVDSTAPVGTSLSAPSTWTDRDTLSIHLSARDNDSGIAAFRFAIWELTSVSASPEEPRYILAGGFVTGGLYQGSAAVSGSLITGESYSGAFSGQGEAAAAPTLESGIEAFEVPPWLEDVEVSTPPWFESQWSAVAVGAPPQSVDLDITISGFPRLSYRKAYRIKVWVKNGAGLISEAGSVTVEVQSAGKTKGGSESGARKGGAEPGLLEYGGVESNL
jgi:hypothetical protein